MRPCISNYRLSLGCLPLCWAVERDGNRTWSLPARGTWSSWGYGKKLNGAADTVRHLSFHTQNPHSQEVSPCSPPALSAPSSLISFFPSSLPSSFGFLLPPNLPAGVTELFMKLWLSSYNFSHSMSVIACTRAEVAGSPPLKMKEGAGRRMKTKTKSSPGALRTEGIQRQPCTHYEGKSRAGPPSSSSAHSRRWTESQLQLHQLKLLGGAAAPMGTGSCINPGMVLWFIGEMCLTEKRRQPYH